MIDYRRTGNCGELRKNAIGKSVSLGGWVHRRRDHGGLIFIDLRDRFGITQLVFDPEKNLHLHQAAERLRSEWVIAVKGVVVPRGEGMANPKMATGEIEIEVQAVEVLSRAKTPPLLIADEMVEANEEHRLRYRYLDMRRGKLADNLALRHRAMMVVRNYLDRCGFLEISTPILANSTPETGARDYLVPSRLYPGHFWALPQSPQMYKQLLMVGGMDRYFQIAPCFRDEDLRADRQPEFTQIDMEMSFGTPEELMAIVEKLLADLFLECRGIALATPFPRLCYREAMERYGTDKPDTRFGMELVDLTDLAERSSFTVFHEVISQGGMVKGLCVKGGATLSRREIDQYGAFVQQFGIKGLTWLKRQEEGVTSSVAKFFPEPLQKELMQRAEVEVGDLLLMIADKPAPLHQGLDQLRRRLAADRNLIPKGSFEPLWVTDFPLFHWNEEEGGIESEHHPFTSPHFEDLHLLDKDPLKVRSLGYDLVLHGYEIAGGSQRIHDTELQNKIFQILGLEEEEVQRRFGFFLEALGYGTPPHLGIALGLDRVMMILCETDAIRDVIAFPKTQKAADLMSMSPSAVSQAQLDLLKLNVRNR